MLSFGLAEVGRMAVRTTFSPSNSAPLVVVEPESIPNVRHGYNISMKAAILVLS